MSDVYKYRIFCQTEGVWKDYYGTEPPSTCPTDTAHTVVTPPERGVKLSADKVIVQEETDGYFKVEYININIPSCTPGETYVHDIVFDDYYLLWTSTLTKTSEMIGDEINVYINPDTTAGYLTSTGAVNDTVLNVSGTVVTNITRGMHIKIVDTGSPGGYQDLGRCIAVDTEASTITVKNPLEMEYPAGSLIQVSVCMVQNYIFLLTGKETFGEKGLRGKTLYPGLLCRIYYKNNDGAAKIAQWKLEYYYGYEVNE